MANSVDDMCLQGIMVVVFIMYHDSLQARLIVGIDHC